MSSQSFGDLGASRAVVKTLADRGITAPFPVQQLVVPDVMAGRDVLVKSPTGSGKTLAFAVPLVEMIKPGDPRPSVLVLAPTRELAIQIRDDMQPLAEGQGLSVAAVYGGAGIEPQIKAARRAHMLVATPGRLEDLLERRAVSLGAVRVLVLDEADRMLDMGFRPPVDRIVDRLPRKRQTLFFSATLDGEVGRLASIYTTDARSHEHAHPAERRGEVQHRFVGVRHETKLDALVRELRDDQRGLTLVFVRTKRGADRLVKRLGAHDVEALAMHGNKSQSQREKALARFESGRVDTLVATDVAARGLDIDDITHVINFDAPDDREGYIHRVGRTGRAGRRGVGVTFVEHEQAWDVHRIAKVLRLEKEFAKSGLSPAGVRGGHHTARGKSPRAKPIRRARSR
jgi:ATP-dependent RNA helicase RhlE